MIPSLKFQMLEQIAEVFREYNPFKDEIEEETDYDYKVCIFKSHS